MKKYFVTFLILGFAIAGYAQVSSLADSNAISPAFNVNAATQHYINTLSSEARAKSDAYFEGGYWLLLWNVIYAILVAGIFLLTGLSNKMKNWSSRFKNTNLQNLFYCLLYFVLTWALFFPLSVYEDYFREHQYGLSNMIFSEWFKENLIQLAISCIGGSLLLVLIYLAMRKTGKNWWIWGAGISIAFAVFIIFITPIFISPLFNKYQPLPDGPLKSEILSMARGNSIPAENVYQFDASKQSDKISANVSGIGGTTRISLNDNLLKRCNSAEIRAVMGHEMGHYVLNHIYKGLLQIAVLLVILFALLNYFLNRIISRKGTDWGISGISDIGSLPLLAALFSLASFLITPAVNSITRTMETEADIFGLNTAREPDAAAHVYMMLSEYRKIDPGYWEEIFFYDHPSGRNRVHMAMQWKSEHLNDAK